MKKLDVRAIANENLPGLNPLLMPLPWVAVCLLIIVFVSVKYAGNIQEVISPKEKPREFPQIFMTDIDMREFNETGALHYQLKTPLVRHFQQGEKAGSTDYTLLDTPRLLFIGKDKPAWNISADAGRSNANNALFTLSKNVVALQTSPTQGEISVTTEEMRVNTRDQFAETDKAVTMRTAKGKMETLGMRADIKNDHLELLSNVKGTYEP